MDAESGSEIELFTTEAQRRRETNRIYREFPFLPSSLSMRPCASVGKSKVLMTEAEIKKHLDAAAKSPQQIAAAVSGLPDAILRYKPVAEKWCILEVLGHLADIEIVYAHRFRQMLADKDPIIAPIDQDAWARSLDYLETPAPELVALYGLNRHHSVQLLRRSKPADLEKGAYHPEFNRKVTVAELLEKLSAHGSNHLQQIEKLKKAAKL
jgi:hypothetical protein